jgi:hypothetical protein
MTRGHRLNTAIPDLASQAEFPLEPWGHEVLVRIKSMSVSPPEAPILVTPSPRTWADVTLGAAPVIDQTDSGPVGYTSPNTGQEQSQTPPDQDAIDELARLRRPSEKDEAVHKLISWTTRKDYPTHIGISLEIQDPVGENTHKIQYWEETKWLPFVSTAEELCNWFAEIIRGRSQTYSLPLGMPETFEGIEVHT